MRKAVIAAITSAAVVSFGLSAAASAQLENYRNTPESLKYPKGSSAERRARMSKVAQSPAYTRKFDLSGLPDYVPQSKPKGVLKLCGNNYVADSPLAGWWKTEFKKYQPGIDLDVSQLQTAAIAIPCVTLGLADIGITHEPSFYDYLSFLRMKGHAPTGVSIFTGSYETVGWQNNMVIIVNKANPLTHIGMDQLDGIFGSERAGGWIGTKWHPEFARGPEKNIRTWGQMGLSGDWGSRSIHTFGYSLRYATALEFSDKVLRSSDKWNGNLLAFGNYPGPDGNTYLEGDQVVDHVRADVGAIGYVRYHPGFPADVKILAVGRTAAGPFIPYTIDTLQRREYPLWGDQSIWFDRKPGQPVDPKIREFIRFVLSRQGQELVEKDGKYLPITPQAAREGLAKLQ
jgi:phosphate transport system substrate-binding protein